MALRAWVADVSRRAGRGGALPPVEKAGAWRRDELYHGPWVQYAPDVVLEFNLDRDYSYTCLPSASAPGASSVRILEPEECAGGKLTGMSGSHRAAGIFILANDRRQQIGS